MKLIKQYGFAFSLLLLFQGTFTLTAFGQSTVQSAIDNKCELCNTYLNNQNIEAYASGSCRIYKSICDLLNKENTIILSEYSENQVFEAAQGVQSTSVSVAFFLENFKEKGYEVVPQMTLLNENKEAIDIIETGYFQLYTFDENQNIVAAEGTKIIKKIDENTSQLMITTLNLPETAKDAAFIHVSLQFIHPKTQETIVIKKMIQPIAIVD